MRSRNDKFTYQNGSDEPGPACVKILTTLKGIQTGKIEDTFGWLEKVEEAKEGSYGGEGGNSNGVGHDMVDKLP